MPQNTLSDKYLSFNGVSDEEQKRITEHIAKETDFEIRELIFTGTLYTAKKVGSLIYAGVWAGQKAVLKIQFLRHDLDEEQITKWFKAQNRSIQIRFPYLLLFSPWEAGRGYGYHISEFIENADQPFYQVPFCTDAEMEKFCRFFEEYKTNAVREPLMPKPFYLKTHLFTVARVHKWAEISKAAGRLEDHQYKRYLKDYYRMIIKHLSFFNSWPIVFCHRHLGPFDIKPQPNGQIIITSNLMWGWAPEWYELGFNIWSCLLRIRKKDGIDVLQAAEYIDRWFTAFERMSVVKDPSFRKKMIFLMSERIIGSILVDIGAHDDFKGTENEEEFRFILELFQQLFHLYT